MTNILTSNFPKSLTVAGKECPINWGHRNCLKIMIELEKKDLTPDEQLIYLVQALYVDIPEEFPEAVERALWFMHGGKPLDEAVAKADPVRTFSYEKDAELIYAAFSTRHGIDMASADMHWWRFRALFADLRETTFSELCSLRKRYHDGECNEYELNAISNMGDAFYLDDLKREDLSWEESRNLEAFEAAERAGIYG